MLTMAAVLLALGMARQEMIVSTDWLAAHLNDRLVQVVYVGNRSDYMAAHIPGARFVAREDVVRDCNGLIDEVPPVEDLVTTFTNAGIGDWKRLVIVSNDPLLATRMWFTLDYLGHGYRASVLDGGMARWKAENRTVSNEVVTPQSTAFTVAERPASLIAFARVRDLVRNRGELRDKFLLIDARPPQYFSGTAGARAIPRPGHIPGAVNIPWTSNLTTQEPPVFRPADDLRAMYTTAGVSNDAAVVAYCRTGMEASMTYFVLRYLGMDVSLYDGSFSEWSSSKDTMVARSANAEPR